MGLDGAPLALALTLTLLVANLSSAKPCIKTAAPPNVMVAHPEGNATLPCLDGGQTDNATDAAHWTLDGQDLPPSLAGLADPPHGLFLPRVQANHSGSYACHVKGRHTRTWRLVVEEPPEAPDFSCRQKSLNNEILCEWRAGRTTSLRTKARLWVQKGFLLGERHSHPCRYYSRSQKFSCRTHGLKEKEDLKLWLSVCIANLAGAATTRHKYFTTETLCAYSGLAFGICSTAPPVVACFNCISAPSGRGSDGLWGSLFLHEPVETGPSGQCDGQRGGGGSAAPKGHLGLPPVLGPHLLPPWLPAALPGPGRPQLLPGVPPPCLLLCHFGRLKGPHSHRPAALPRTVRPWSLERVEPRRCCPALDRTQRPGTRNRDKCLKGSPWGPPAQPGQPGNSAGSGPALHGVAPSLDAAGGDSHWGLGLGLGGCAADLLVREVVGEASSLRGAEAVLRPGPPRRPCRPPGLPAQRLPAAPPLPPGDPVWRESGRRPPGTGPGPLRCGQRPLLPPGQVRPSRGPSGAGRGG